MRRINTGLSGLTILLRYCAYALSRLRGNPALSEEANLLEGAATELQGSLQSNQVAINSAMAALAVRDARKYELDVALRAARLGVLSIVRNNRGSQIYRTIFPNGFADVLRSNPVDEINQARNVLRRMTELQSPALGPAAEALQVAIDALVAAITDSEAADRAEADSRVTLLNVKIRFASQYEDIYRRLTNILGDWRLAETYFRRFPKVKAVADPVPEDVPQAEGTAVPRLVVAAEGAPAGATPASSAVTGLNAGTDHDAVTGTASNLNPDSGTEADQEASAA